MTAEERFKHLQALAAISQARLKLREALELLPNGKARERLVADYNSLTSFHSTLYGACYPESPTKH